MNSHSIAFEDVTSLRFEFELESTGRYPFFTLIARWTGRYGLGSEGRPDACYILGLTRTAIEVWEPATLVLDLSGLEYEWGDEMDWLLPPDVPVPAAVVVGPGCERAIATLLWGPDTTQRATEAEFIFDNIESAWEAVRYRGQDDEFP